MAGMFSLLHKSQMRLDANSAALAYDDMTMDFRAAAPSSSPLPGRRLAGIGQGYMKPPASNADRLPKRFRKRSWYHKCYEIHPVLRRSICTILLAVIGLLTGCTLFLIDYLKYKKISKVGLAILGISFGFCLIGIIWFWWSFSKLKKFKKKLKEIKALRESRQEDIIKTKPMMWTANGSCDPAALSACKWPVKKVGDGEEFDCRGKYLPAKDHCSSESIDRSMSTTKEQRRTLKSDEYYYSSSESLYESEAHRKKAREAKGEHSGDPKRSEAEQRLDFQMVPQIFVTRFSSEQNLRHQDNMVAESLEMQNIRN